MWLSARLKRQGQSADEDTLAFLAQRVEGNLLAAFQEIQKLAANLGSGPEQQAQAQIQALGDESSYLLNMQKSVTASKTIQTILAVPHTNILISGIIFQQATPTVPTRTLQLTGVAKTREALRSFDAALSALPYVSSADLPISSYAKDTDIPFTITLTGTLQP
jgi:hypothetical protein